MGKDATGALRFGQLQVVADPDGETVMASQHQPVNENRQGEFLQHVSGQGWLTATEELLGTTLTSLPYELIY